MQEQTESCVLRVGNTDFEFIRIPSGEFTMGSDKTLDENACDDESPQHLVFLEEYWIAKYPVSFQQYDLFVKDTDGSIPYPGYIQDTKKDHPVNGVSWFDAINFCNWLTQKTGYHISLPSEAEWEKAARGNTGQIYPWGNSVKQTKYYYTVLDRKSKPIGSFSPDLNSPFGCVDMGGNVKEWTSSLYMPYPYREDDGREDQDAPGYRVMKNGCYDCQYEGARCAARFKAYPESPDLGFGFRICLRK